MDAVNKAAVAIRNRQKNGCTGCRYCMPCPNGVDIPKTFRIWNTYGMYDNRKKARENYASIPEENLPTACIGCGACEAVCPQHLNIIGDLKMAGKELSEL